jgi:hypothetical protein
MQNDTNFAAMYAELEDMRKSNAELRRERDEAYARGWKAACHELSMQMESLSSSAAFLADNPGEPWIETPEHSSTEPTNG